MNRHLLYSSLALAVVMSAGSAHAAITVYSAGPNSLIDSLAAGFSRQSGIEVKVFQATTGQLMARIEAESANPVVDVLISASWDSATAFAERGWLLPYTSPNAAQVPAGLKTDTAVAQGVSALAIAWNPSSGTPAPSDWEDLTQPAYKDLVNLPDPARSGAAFELTSALQAEYGWTLFERLNANGAQVAGANAAALNPVLQGAKAAVFGAVDYISLAAQARGENLAVIFPASGTVIAPRPAMILNWSKQPEEAKRFVDYLLSDEGQAMVAAAYLMPARSDIAADRPTIDELSVLAFDVDAAYADRNDTLNSFARIFSGQ